MTAEIKIDSTEYLKLARTLAQLPDELKRRAFWAARQRVGSQFKTQLLREMSKRLKTPQKVLRERTKEVIGNNESISIKVASDWIPLPDIGGRRMRKALNAKPKNSSYSQAFLGRVKAKKAGEMRLAVLRRIGPERLPVEELFGPNPAHDIVNNEDDYLRLMQRFIDEKLMARFLHEIEYRMGKL